MLLAVFAVSRDVSSAIQYMLEFWQDRSQSLTQATKPSACSSKMALCSKHNERNKLVKIQVWDASTSAFVRELLSRDSSTGPWLKFPCCKVRSSTQLSLCSGVKSTAELDIAADSRQVSKCLKV